MKVIFFGLGSIGQRHLANLQTLCKDKGIAVDIHAMRTSRREINTDGLKSIYHFDDLDEKYDIAFITNPTSLHYETIKSMQNRATYYFIEKPIFNKIYPEITAWPNPKHYYVACPLRYKKIMQFVREIVDRETVLNARVICSTYLPNWRKDDYRKSYSADPNLGGGVELDCIHELDYIVDLFGFPEKTQHMFGKVSSLEIDSHDIAVYLLRYPDKFVELHLDYFGQQSQRKIELITESDLITVDLLSNQISFSMSKELIAIEEDYNQFYLNEMSYFLEQVVGLNNNHNDLIHANKILQVALGESR